MTNRYTPLFVDEKVAAYLFCMKESEFRCLVARGHLPGPRNLGGYKRWDVEELRKIARGEIAESGGMDW